MSGWIGTAEAVPCYRTGFTGAWVAAMDCGFGVLVVAVAGECGVGEAGGGAGLGLGEALTFAIEDELTVVDQLHAVGLGKALCAFANEVDVGRFF